MLFEGIAYAQAAAGSQAGGEQVIYTTVVPLALLFGIFYFVLIRPQTKKAAEHSKMLRELKRNDEVVTTGGIVGKITEIGDRLVTVEIAPNVRVRVERPQIAAVSPYSKSQTKKEKGD
jgi:preprotein translocase subunit YajC